VLKDLLEDLTVFVEEPLGQQQQFTMVGRFGRGGLIKNVLGGVMSGIADGGIGGGNVLRHVAAGIVGGGGGGQTSRAVPGRLDFSDAPDTPGMSTLTPPYATYPPMYDDDETWMHSNATRPDMEPNPRPGKMPRLDDFSNSLGTTTDGGTTTTGGYELPVSNAGYAGQDGGLYGNMAGTGLNQDSYTQTTGGCSCRKKYTCEEKCAYNAAMKEKCKGCKTYFRKTKKWIYPKRRKTSYRRSYRRNYRKSYRRGGGYRKSGGSSGSPIILMR